MNRFLIIIFLFILTSCANRTVKQYESLVDRADKIVIRNPTQPDSIVIVNSTLLLKIKDVLKQGIEPVSPRKFIVKEFISLYEQNKTIGTLMISNGEEAFVNFQSAGLNFTFPKTYGIGFSLNEIIIDNNH